MFIKSIEQKMKSNTFSRFNILIYKIFPRQATKKILNLFGNKELIGVEIGTEKGRNAESILKLCNIKKLYLIDPYLPYTDKTDGYFHNEKEVNSWKNESKKRVKRFIDKVIFVEKNSSDAINDVPNNLDFIYIDGIHEYENVKQDIKNYYPKLKKGGLLSGDDISREDVAKAVWEFSIKLNKHYIIDGADWYIIK